MQEGKRQKQVAGLLNEELNGIFQRLGLTMLDGGMVSIAAVKITPDLLEARIYLSLFQVKDPGATLKRIEDRAWEIKKELTAKVAKQLRRMPELKFFHDDTLDQVFKMEELLRQIKQEESKAADTAVEPASEKKTQSPKEDAAGKKKTGGGVRGGKKKAED